MKLYMKKFYLLNALFFISVKATIMFASPAFIKDGLYESQQAQVLKIVNHENVDVIYLDKGFNAGFDVGMNVSVYQNLKNIAKLIVVESSKLESVGMIISIQKNEKIRIGDVIRPEKI